MPVDVTVRPPRRPGPPPSLLTSFARSRTYAWLRRHPRIVDVGIPVTALGILGGLIWVMYWLGPSFGPVAVVLPVTLFFCWAMVRRSPMRHGQALARHRGLLRAYREAGAPEWGTGMLWAAGLSPADVAALVERGYTDMDLSRVGITLADHPDRSVDVGLTVLHSVDPTRRSAVVALLGQVLDMVAEDPAAGSTLLALLVDPTCPPTRAVAVAGAGLAVLDWQILAPVVDGLADRSQRHPEPVHSWDEVEARVWGEVVKAWPQRPQGYLVEALAQWIDSDLFNLTEYGWIDVSTLERWVPGGVDAAWWHMAAYTPQEAASVIASGQAPTRRTLQGMASLARSRRR
jgi:hypothetical protein